MKFIGEKAKNIAPLFQKVLARVLHRRVLHVILVVFALMVLVVIIRLFLLANTIIVEQTVDYEYENFSVKEEEDRIDVLLLGIRGESDPAGGLLADTMILMSFDKSTEKMSMVSIPRDLFVEFPDIQIDECSNLPEAIIPLPEDRKVKINAAYAIGRSCNPNGGLEMAKEVVQYVSGVHVDYAAVINFTGFKRLIEIFGGVEITLEQPFIERQQWQGEEQKDNKYWRYYTAEPTEGDANKKGGYWEFHVPAGTNVLDSESALYYIRSRFSSSDFDRARRQQQVINALKDKALSSGVLSNPKKVFDSLESIGRNVRTDMSISDMKMILSLMKQHQLVVPTQEVLQPGEGGLLESQIIDGAYVIVPTQGDWSAVRHHFQDILNEE